MAQQSTLIQCRVRVVDGKCKVHEYAGAYLSTGCAVMEAIDRFEPPLFSVSVVATGSCLFKTPNLESLAQVA